MLIFLPPTPEGCGKLKFLHLSVHRGTLPTMHCNITHNAWTRGYSLDINRGYPLPLDRTRGYPLPMDGGAGGMPLAFTQEDFIFVFSIYIYSIILRYLHSQYWRGLQCLYAHVLRLTTQQIQREEEPCKRKR